MSLKQWLQLNLFIKLYDVSTTGYLVERFGLEGEANPIVKWTMQEWGLANALLANFAWAGLLCFILYISKQKTWLKATALVMSPVLVINGYSMLLAFKAFFM